ncbi:MAG: DEAD/DEAH box helicase family protein [Prevotella sp.]|nr:DEAD/DEAH box helicase family protein [Prevotella sp.]
MNITLKTFQKLRARELRKTFAMAQMSWQHFGQKQIISLTAPTGAGKTILMARFIEDLLCGDEEGMVAPLPESIVVWLSDAPELNEQSKKKIERYCDRIVFGQCKTLDESFRGEKLEPGKIYFLNTQKLSKTSKMTQTGDGRDWTIWETLQNTIDEYGQHLVLIIDEAHRGAKVNQTTTMQKFVKGFKDDGQRMDAWPIIIGMSATVERFNTLASASLSTLSKVVVTPAEVRNSGLLKDTIEIHYPEESVINKNIAVLQTAADEWKDKCLHWYNYTEKQHYQNVCPIFLIQVEPAAGGKPSATDLDECLQEIEKRTGEHFETGEVVHAFTEQGDLPVNGLTVPYCQPSAINDDRHIKIVFFKEALSTGWDCPRAECMMSFRVARDATYIAQLLGRMIRTPRGERVEVDETLNYVHLYLPNFDKDTVKHVVDKLNEEGGALPVEIQSVEGSKRQTVVMTTKRPVQPVTNNATPTKQELNNSGSAWQVEKPQSAKPEFGEPMDFKQSSEVSNTKPTPTPAVDPYEEVKNAINMAEIHTYEVKTVAVTKNYMRSLFELAHLAVISGMDETGKVVDSIKDDIVGMIRNYVTELRSNGEYDALVDKALQFQLNTISVELYKNNASYETTQGPDLYSTTDAGVEHQFMLAEVQLCNEGIGKRYADKYEDDIDDNTALYDVILYVADEHQRDKRMDYAKKRFFELADAYRSKTKTVPEEYRKKYNGLVTQSSEVSPPLLFHLPDNINVDLDVDGEPCTDHLFVNAEGTANFKLKGWEPITLEEERKHPNYVCWLRNQERKPWALCVPYKYGEEIHRTYPDFLIVRKDCNGNYDFALLEPHRDDKKDNLAKAKGLCDYAEKCPAVSRVQMLRLVNTPSGKKMKRLDFCKMAIRERVRACNTEPEFDNVFSTDGEME